jgi:hypothetical protein
VFYPVDLQGVPDGQSQSSSRTGQGSAQDSGVSPSPPEPGVRRPVDRGQHFNSFPSLPSNAPPYGSLPLEPRSALAGQSDISLSVERQATSNVGANGGSGTSFRFDVPVETRQPWSTARHPNSMGPPVSTSDELAASSYWQANAPSLQADFLPFPGAQTATRPAPESTFAFTQPNPVMPTWHSSQNPTTLASYGDGQDRTQLSYAAPHMMFTQPGHPAHVNGHATFPSLDMQRAISHPPVTGPYSAPAATPTAPFGHPQAFTYPPQGQLADSPQHGQQHYHGSWYQPNGYDHAQDYGQQCRSDQSNNTNRPP